MPRPTPFRCPACKATFVGAELSRHLAEHPEERTRLFARFVAQRQAAPVAAPRCSAADTILPLMDAEEKARFGVLHGGCGAPVLACGCTGSFCAHHAFSCASCGRFACLRHRWTARCPDCIRAATPKPVRVAKYDPFSKQRSTIIRTYPRSGGPRVWDAVAGSNP